jgi:hypothetical protein
MRTASDCRGARDHAASPRELVQIDTKKSRKGGGRERRRGFLFTMP